MGPTMFESLTLRLNSVFKSLTDKGRLTTNDVDEALRHVRIALLEADVHFKVVKEFISSNFSVRNLKKKNNPALPFSFRFASFG